MVANPSSVEVLFVFGRVLVLALDQHVPVSPQMSQIVSTLNGLWKLQACSVCDFLSSHGVSWGLRFDVGRVRLGDGLQAACTVYCSGPFQGSCLSRERAVSVSVRAVVQCQVHR